METVVSVNEPVDSLPTLPVITPAPTLQLESAQLTATVWEELPTRARPDVPSL